MNASASPPRPSGADQRLRLQSELWTLGAVRAMGGPSREDRSMMPVVAVTAAAGVALSLRLEHSLDLTLLPPEPIHPVAQEILGAFRRAAIMYTIGAVDEGTLSDLNASAWSALRTYFARCGEWHHVEAVLKLAAPLVQESPQLAAGMMANAAELLMVSVRPWVQGDGAKLEVNAGLFRSLYLPYRYAAQVDVACSSLTPGVAAAANLAGGGYDGALVCAGLRALAWCSTQIVAEDAPDDVLASLEAWNGATSGPVCPAYLASVMGAKDRTLWQAHTRYADLWDEVGHAVGQRCGAVGKAALLKAWRDTCCSPRDQGALDRLKAALGSVAPEALQICGHRRLREDARPA